MISKIALYKIIRAFGVLQNFEPQLSETTNAYYFSTYAGFYEKCKNFDTIFFLKIPVNSTLQR